MYGIILSTATVVNPEVTSTLNNFFTTTFHGLLLLLVAGVVYGVKLGLGQIKNGLIRSFTQRAVAFAQNRLTGRQDKRHYVAAKIHEKFPRIPEEEIDHYLEEAVIKLRQGLVE